jgi:hypothetical protein
MTSTGGICAACALPVQRKTKDSLQCMRGYSGVRTGFPGRGGGHEDFWWCCNCLLKFRGTRSNTTPCEFCLVRTDEVWNKVKAARTGLENAKKAKAKEVADALLSEWNVQLEELTSFKQNTEKEIKKIHNPIKVLMKQKSDLEAEIVGMKAGDERTRKQTEVTNLETKITDALSNIDTENVVSAIQNEQTSKQAEVHAAANEQKKIEKTAELERIMLRLAHAQRLKNGLSEYTTKIAHLQANIKALKTEHGIAP